jgi:esterase/lipase superfamily enzyme
MTRSLKISRALVGSTPNDPSYDRQWAWDKMEVVQAWESIDALRPKQSISKEPVTVAIVDWGIQRDHEAFRPELVAPGVNVIPKVNGNIGDDDGHGTMLAGTIAGIVTNVPGGGCAASPARLLPVRFIDTRNPPMSGNAASAIRYAVDAGAKIINASWDVGLSNPQLQDAIQYAEDNNALVVVAAGNGGSNNADYATFPACFEFTNMITVMASDAKDEKPGFSNYGDNVDIAAPGVDIISASPYILPSWVHQSPFGSHAYRRYRGTSPAAAHVSGAAALVASINPGWTPQEIRACLMESSDNITALQSFCPQGRRLNVRRAVERALQPENASSSQGISSDTGRMHTRTRLRRSTSPEPEPPSSAHQARKNESVIWHGTNRQPIDPGDTDKGYSTVHDDVVHYGSCRVFVPQSHKIGSVGSPWWKRLLTMTDDRLRLIAIDELRESVYWNGIAAQLAATDAKERCALIFVHGYNVSFQQAALRAAQIGFDLSIKGAMAFFSWPSQGSLLGYPADAARIEASEDVIADFMTDFAGRSGANAVHIIAHSMGNRGVLRAVNRIAAQAHQRTGKPFDQIILAAADVDADVFRRLSAAYAEVASRTTLYVSRRDRAVEASRWLHSYPRAGLMPPTLVLPGIDTINVTNADLTMLGHGYIAEAKDVLRDMHLILRGASPRERFGLREAKNEEGQRYWLIGA